MPDIKRLNYFNSQFLVATDFNDEQAYHSGMRQRHNRSLHSWGVADGGLLPTTTGPKVVSISAGMAIDKDGQEIVLLDARTIDFSAFQANTDVYVTICYQDFNDPADLYTSGGVNNYTRWTERPLVEASTDQPDTDGSVVTLAKVHLDASGNVTTIDQSVRTVAGSRINPASSVQIGALSIGTSTANNHTLEISSNKSVAGASAIRTLSTIGGALAGTEFAALANRGSQWQAVYAKAGTGGAVALYTDGKVNLMNGNVGIGTTSPTLKLDVSGVAGDLNPPASSGTTNRGISRFGLSDRTWGGSELNMGIINASPYPVWFQAQQPTDLSVNRPLLLNPNGGNVGIGTSQPGAKLEINNGDLLLKGAAEDAGDIVFQSGSGTQKARIWSQAAAGTGLFLSSGDSAADVAIDSSGRVGLGTNSPDRSLTIANATGANYMNVKDGTRQILLGVDGTGGILSVMTNHDLVMRAGVDSEKLRITATGNVGIGTTSPGAKLEVVNANASAVRALSGAAGSWTSYALGRASVDTEWGVAAAAGQLASDSSSGDVVIKTTGPSTQRLILTNGAGASAVVVKGGNVGIGVIDPIFLLHVGISGQDQALRVEGPSDPRGIAVSIGGRGAFQIDAPYKPGGRFIVTDGGNVGIGKDDPTRLLNVGGDIEISGNAFKPTGGSWTTTSDISLKKNVEPLTDALGTMLRLHGFTFEWKDPSQQLNLSGTQIGLVAQDVEQVFPDWVGAFPDGTKHVTIRGFEALTVEAIREIHAMVERFAQRLELVEQRLGVAAPATLERAPDSAASEKAQSGPAKKSTGRRSKKTETDQPGQTTS